nr:unnamed protein product [Spirometra erinaceieuropaei]
MRTRLYPPRTDALYHAGGRYCDERPRISIVYLTDDRFPTRLSMTTVYDLLFLGDCALKTATEPDVTWHENLFASRTGGDQVSIAGGGGGDGDGGGVGVGVGVGGGGGGGGGGDGGGGDGTSGMWSPVMEMILAVDTVGCKIILNPQVGPVGEMAPAEEPESNDEQAGEKLLPFAEENFAFKQCKYFIDESGGGDDVLHDQEDKAKRRCYCGEYEENHPRLVESDPGPWNKDFFQLQFPTNAYGTISYGDRRNTNGTSSFVRLADVHDKADVLLYLEQECKLLEGEPPQMCIVMADTSDNYQLPEGKLKLLEGYLYSLAITTEVIFISSGFNTAISKLTGRICRRASEYRQAENGDCSDKYRSIGILPWSKVKKSEILEAKGEIVYTVQKNEESTEQYDLCSAYRDFIIIDDGYRRGRVGKEFESYAAGICEKMRAPTTEKGWGLPVILLVAGGDYEVLQTVLAYTGLGLPVVVIRNNCGAPNALWEFFTLCGGSRKNVAQLIEDNRSDIERILVRNLSIQRTQTSVDEMINVCRRIAETWDLIKFVSLNEESNLDIIQSIIIETAKDDIRAVKLSVKLDRTDLAKERLSSVQELPSTYEAKDLLRYQVSLLLMSYWKTHSLLRDERKALKEFKADTEIVLLPADKGRSTVVLDNLDYRNKALTPLNNRKSYKCSSEELRKRTFQGPFQELFLWAVLRQRHELAVFLWRKCQDGVFLAVFASCLSRRIARVIPSHESQRILQVLANADEFEDMAVTMISSCVDVYPDIKWTIPTLTKVSWNCADTEWLGLVGRCRRFIGAREMQDYIYFKWTNDMNSRTLPVALLLYGEKRSNDTIYQPRREQNLPSLLPNSSLPHSHRQFVIMARKCGKYHFDFFLSLSFVWLETAIALQLFICLFMRLFLRNRFYLVKSFAAVLLLTLYCRLFLFLRASRRLGPAMMTLFALIKVALVFTVIVLVILLPSGISQEALLFPNETVFTSDTVYNIVFYDYYRLFGELNLERARGEEEGCPTNDTTVDCPVYNALVPIIVACYMLIANIFLVNFLIAIFNNVIEEAETEALGMWKYNLLLETEQYNCRYILPPPLTLLEMIFRGFKALICKEIRCSKAAAGTGEKTNAESEETSVATGNESDVGEEEPDEKPVPFELSLEESQEARMQANQTVLNLALIETEKAEEEAERQMEMPRLTKLRQTVEDVLNEAADSLAALTVPEETTQTQRPTTGPHIEEEEAPPSVEEVQQLLLTFEKQVHSLVSLMNKKLWKFVKMREKASEE